MPEPLVGDGMNPLERKPDAGKPHVRFDERGVETECMAGYSGTSNRKGWSQLWPVLPTAAPLLDSTCAVKRRGTPVGELTKPTRQLSLQPVAAEAGMEAMKCPKPLVQKAPLKGVSERAGRNMMNTGEVPKPSNAEADPAETWGRLPGHVKRAKRAACQSAGALVTACSRRSSVATREVPRSACAFGRRNLLPVRAGQGCLG